MRGLVGILLISLALAQDWFVLKVKPEVISSKFSINWIVPFNGEYSVELFESDKPLVKPEEEYYRRFWIGRVNVKDEIIMCWLERVGSAVDILCSDIWAKTQRKQLTTNGKGYIILKACQNTCYYRFVPVEFRP